MIDKKMGWVVVFFVFFLLYLFFWFVPLTHNERRAVCLVTDQFERADKTVKSLAKYWSGDVILITTKEKLSSATKYLSSYTHVFAYPMVKGTSPSRIGRPLFQQFKIYMFHPDLKDKWDVILYMDAGMTVRAPVGPIFDIEPWHGAIVASSDAKPTYVWKLDTQFEHLSGDPKIPFGNCDYFQTTCMLYDAQKFCSQETISTLLNLFAKYPNHRTNEQAIMNILFHYDWVPFREDIFPNSYSFFYNGNKSRMWKYSE